MKRASQTILLLLMCSILLMGFNSISVIHKKAEAVESINLLKNFEPLEVNKPTPTTTVLDTTEVKPQITTPTDNTFVVTAYCICYDCCGKTPDHPKYGITATGTKATPGRTIAVDPTVIPFGSVVMLGGQEYVAEDTGDAIKGNRVDICFENHQEALNFGRQRLEGVVIEGE